MNQKRLKKIDKCQNDITMILGILTKIQEDESNFYTNQNGRHKRTEDDLNRLDAASEYLCSALDELEAIER